MACNELHDFKLQDLYTKDFLPENEFKRWMATQRLLHGSMNCDLCQQPMHLEQSSRPGNQPFWRCNRKIHQTRPVKGFMASFCFVFTKRELKVGTFFENSHLSVKQAFKLSYFWAQKYSIEHAVRESGIAKSKVVEWFKKFRSICSTYFRRNPVRLGGVNSIVEVDETFMSRRHGRRGRRVRRNSKWLLTMVQRGTGLSWMQVVRRRNQATLLAIILRHILPFTDVHTDQWRAYRGLARFPMFRHRFVNHNANFVDPQDRTLHTQTIENKNGQWKKWVRIRNGLGDRSIRPHLKEFLWRERFGARNEVFYNFWSQVAILYPCNP